LSNENWSLGLYLLLSFYITAAWLVLQVREDLRAIWDWILIEKLHIPRNERNMYSAILVMPETFDNRGI
jgi:actin-related protein 8